MIFRFQPGKKAGVEFLVLYCTSQTFLFWKFKFRTYKKGILKHWTTPLKSIARFWADLRNYRYLFLWRDYFCDRRSLSNIDELSETGFTVWLSLQSFLVFQTKFLFLSSQCTKEYWENRKTWRILKKYFKDKYFTRLNIPLR